MLNINFAEIQENLDFELAQEKKLIINNNFTNYSKIYDIYRYGLEQVIKKMTPLEMYDKKIKESDLGFLEVLSEEKDFYQYPSTLKYFYLRNNLYIERLSIENIKKIQKINIENSEDLNILYQIVMTTYEDIIIEYPDTDKNTIISLGFDDINMMPYNGGIIIGFRYDEYRNEVELGNNWQANYIKQVQMLQVLLPEVQKNLAAILKNNVRVIQYNEFSIKKRTKV